MWTSLCLIAVALVGVSYQRAPVLTKSNYYAGADAGALNAGEFTVFEPPTTPAAAVQNDTCPRCTCGALGKNLGIVGGNSTYVDEYPWMALLMYRNETTICGGSLINDKYVLTAAHCVESEQKEDFIVRLLEYDRSTTSDSKSQDSNVLEIIVHEKYDSWSYKNDIALLRLDTKVIFSPESKIHPVCLPEKGNVARTGVVIGWGYNREHNGIEPNVLQQVSVPIISNGLCSELYKEEKITKTMICAGYRSGGKDSCQGDSGGPLHIIRNNEYCQIVGIVSWGLGCAKPDQPGVYTRVSEYLDWLAVKTKDACSCKNVDDLPKTDK